MALASKNGASYGISLLIFNYIQRWRTLISGNSRPAVNTRPSRPMKVSSLVPPILDRGKESGKLGHRQNEKISCGWLDMIDAGPQTVLHAMGCPTWRDVPFVTKRVRPSTIYLSHACLQDNFGSISSDRSVCILYHRSLRIIHLMNGGKELAMQ